MHIKTALQMLNAIEKVETTDLIGKQLKNETQKVIADYIKDNFTELDLIYKSGKGFATNIKINPLLSLNS